MEGKPKFKPSGYLIIYVPRSKAPAQQKALREIFLYLSQTMNVEIRSRHSLMKDFRKQYQKVTQGKLVLNCRLEMMECIRQYPNLAQ